MQIASDFGLNEYVSQIISGVILFFILGSEFFINYRIVPRHHAHAGQTEKPEQPENKEEKTA